MGKIGQLIVAFLFAFQSLFASAIVFVHIGDALPSYAEIAIQQALAFNPKTPIYMISSERALAHLQLPVHKIAYETLAPSQEHSDYRARYPHLGYWRYVVERFFYLDEFLTQHQLEHVVHLENDVMIYFELEQLISVFDRCYSSVGGTFLNDGEGVPGIVYIPNKESLRSLMPFFAEMGGKGHSDMRIFGQLRQRKMIQDLPIIPANYPKEHRMNTPNPERFTEHVEEFGSIFDGAALGQYLGGVDPLFGPPKPGFVNWNSVFDPRHFEYSWEVDEQGRNIPYLHSTCRKYRINNLHIHSKQLEKFTSSHKQ